MKNILIITFLFCCLSVTSQENKLHKLSWKTKLLDNKECLFVEGYSANLNKLPVFTEKIKAPVGISIEVNTTIKSKSLLSSSELSALEADLKREIKQSVTSNIYYSTQNHIRYAIIEYSPLIKIGNSYYKVTQFNSNYKKVNSVAQSSVSRSNRSFKSSSVLVSGEFFKVNTRNNGVNKVTYEYLLSNGAISGSVNSNLINVYGNHNGMLPEENGLDRVDDLNKNAIKMMDGGDGNFDEGDYFLFYGQSPNKWEFNSASSLFEYQHHLYSDVSVYFINVSDNTGAKRILSVSQATPSNTTVTSFNDFRVKEDEIYNLLNLSGRGGSGKLWVGDIYDAKLSYSYPFSFPNIELSSPVSIRANVLSKSTASTNFVMSVSGLGSTSMSIAGIFASAHSSVALERKGSLTINPNSSSLTIGLVYNKTPGVTGTGYLDYLEVNARRNLVMNGNQLEFRDINSVAVGNVSTFNLQQAADIQEVWDVTNPSEVLNVSYSRTGGTLFFEQATDSLRTFIGFKASGFYEPTFVGKVESQNLHGQSTPDLLLVYHPLFEQQVSQLKKFHESNGLEVLAATVEEIYNEFSGGIQDVSAIKTFAKMYYDRGGNKLKYLLLFGDCSYDYKGRATPNHNFVPIWESANSLSDVSSFTTDDFYALLDDGESMGDYELMDIAVGRLTVTNSSQAQNLVNKIINYQKTGSASEALNCNAVNSGSSFGDWRNKLTFSTDDVDATWELGFVRHTESVIDSIKKNYPTFNFNKVYMDAFNQTSASGGERYEEGAEQIKKSVQEGSLIITYEGHGGEIGWGTERFLDIPTINGWSNFDRLSVFLTATCEFTKFDDPSRTSAGELCILNNNGGAIALFTTTRPVYQYSNERLIDAFFDVAFVKQSDGTPKTMGEIYMETKNNGGVIGDNNVRRFSLIGDPALNLAFPKNKVVTTEVNNVPITGALDTLKALSKITIKGYVSDFSGSKLGSYNGFLFPTIYDKPQQLNTLGNRTLSDVIPYELQNSVLYKGKATVKNGDFEFTFIVPKDINYQFGYGKISYYCFDGNEDGAGYFLDAVVGGTDLTAIADKEGPTVGLYMNDNNFVSGGMTNETPSIYAEIFDSNGINTTGNGIGHDITAILDEKSSNPIILNSYYESDLDSYQSGKVNYPMEKLTEGNHSLSLKTWDTQNNSTEQSIEFVVVNKAELAIDHVLNYPNPFTTRTQFFFEHNQHCEFLEVQIQVFTVSGKLVKTLNQLVKTEGYRAEAIEWDGKDDFGDRIGRGTYVYKVKVVDNEGNKVEKYEKLVLLK